MGGFLFFAGGGEGREKINLKFAEIIARDDDILAKTKMNFFFVFSFFGMTVAKPHHPFDFIRNPFDKNILLIRNLIGE